MTLRIIATAVLVAVACPVAGQEDESPRVICHCLPSEAHAYYLKLGAMPEDEYSNDLPRSGFHVIEHDHKLSIVFEDIDGDLQSLETQGFTVIESRTPQSKTRLLVSIHPISGTTESYLLDLNENGTGTALFTQIRGSLIMKSAKLVRYQCSPLD